MSHSRFPTDTPAVVTCGLPYANGDLHIGSLRTYVGGDVTARALRKLGQSVAFVSGSDMHGTPIAVNAQQEAHLREQGVGVHLDAEVTELVGDDGTVAGVRTATTEIDSDMVVIGTGVRPNVELAVDAGIERGPTGAIATDEYRRTSVSNSSPRVTAPKWML